jgi:hypothetical protein
VILPLYSLFSPLLYRFESFRPGVSVYLNAHGSVVVAGVTSIGLSCKKQYSLVTRPREMACLEDLMKRIGQLTFFAIMSVIPEQPSPFHRPSYTPSFISTKKEEEKGKLDPRPPLLIFPKRSFHQSRVSWRFSTRSS